MNLTQVELDSLKASKTEQEWNDTCDAIKRVRCGSFPPDWFAKILAGGILLRASENWS